MSYVKFSLLNSLSLHTMAAAGPGAVAAGFLVMPAAGGFYVIRNQRSDNRYVGKARNFQRRFNSRMAAVNELGLRQADLAQLDVFYGQVACYNTPAPFVPGALLGPGGAAAAPAPAPLLPVVPVFVPVPPIGVNGAGAAPIRPAEAPALACPPPNYALRNVTTIIDGRVVNLEALLIRYFLRVGFGGSMTNAQLSGQFNNASNFQMDVMVEWAAGVSTAVAAGHTEIQLAPNSSF